MGPGVKCDWNDLFARNGAEAVRIALEQVTTKPVYEFILIDDFVAGDCAVDWLIKGILEKDCLAVLFGESGSMKSFLAIDMCCAIAGESEWCGRKIQNNLPTFYIAGEGHNGLKRRFKARLMQMPGKRGLPILYRQDTYSGARHEQCSKCCQYDYNHDEATR